MDTKSGELLEESQAMRDLRLGKRDREDLESFEIGEIVQVKSGFFEITSIKLAHRRPRLVLKPILRTTDGH